MLDPLATSYLCFYLDHADLKAGDVPHATMKKSLDLAIQFARDQGAQVASNTAAGAQATAQDQARQQAINQQVQEAHREEQMAQSSPPAYDNASIMSMLPGYYSNYYSGGYGYWQPWMAYLPGAGAGPVVVSAQSSQPGQKNDKHMHLGPNVPAQRDPKTGQPLPPPIVTDTNTNGQTNPQRQPTGAGTPAPSVPVQNVPAPNHQVAPAPNHQIAPAPNHQVAPEPNHQAAPAPNHQVAPTPPVQHSAPPSPPPREAPAQEQPAQRAAPAAPARGGSEAPARK
jgi:hypothetical protein